MSAETEQFEGACLCGAVRFVATRKQMVYIGVIARVVAGIPVRRLPSLWRTNPSPEGYQRRDNQLRNAPRPLLPFRLLAVVLRLSCRVGGSAA